MLFLQFIVLSVFANPQFSTAGFYPLDNTGRSVYSLNPNWKLFKGVIKDASNVDFDDSKWGVVSVPNGVELLPAEASGCMNYQGEVWYRKHLNLDGIKLNSKVILHFEAIMGKSKVYINGKLVKEQFGGFLPVIIDATEHLNLSGDNVIAVWADNSDDPSYPPGKKQDALDFAYFAGIYRDVWLISHSDTYITDANFEDTVAGGGLFVSYSSVSEERALVDLKLNLKTDSNRKSNQGVVEFKLLDSTGKVVAKELSKFSLSNAISVDVASQLKVNKPSLWSPELPSLYRLEIRVKNNKGKVIDGYARRIGIRSFEFKGEDGFWLNGKPYPYPLIGANRHQDYAVVGNAVSNNAHWRDAKKLRDAGLKVIRNAHYPQDPAFMDACDELGLLVIVNTPGWQFWNEDPIFEQRVYSDIRNMVRRDRNHASVWLWEPILNETWYPDYFAKRVDEIVHAEYPYASCYTACDASARGSEYFKIHFGHPNNADKEWATGEYDKERTYFTREWGDNVDTWISHNSPSRVSRAWGEQPMLVQAIHYAKPTYDYTSYDGLYRTSRHHVGGALWHAFDHQRGYHPDPFYGGIMDAYRQPKYSYYMFKSQRDARENHPTAESGPTLTIAHEMTPFSSSDVTVYSNCDEVRLKYTSEGQQYIYKKELSSEGMPSPIIKFKDVYDFMIDKRISMYENKSKSVFLAAEGYIDGKLAVVDTVYPSRRPTQIVLSIDSDRTNLVADGSDFVTVVAAIADEYGRTKHLTNRYIEFSVEGEGELIGNEDTMTNPVIVEWGTAPVLLRSTTIAGEIKVKARVLFEGLYQPMSAEVTIKSIEPTIPLLYTVYEKSNSSSTKRRNSEYKSDRKGLETLKEVGKQQLEFGENR